MIHLAPFTDAALWTDTMGKARFWEQNSFYGVDLSALYNDAKDEMFGKQHVYTGCSKNCIILVYRILISQLPR